MNYTAASYDVSALNDATLNGLTDFFMVYGIVILIIAIISVIANWMIFKKANKPGWASIVPIYNIVVQYQIVKMNPLLILLYLIPFVNIVAAFVLTIVVSVKLAHVFGKGTLFGLGLIFLPVIFYPILAFGKAQYEG